MEASPSYRLCVANIPRGWPLQKMSVTAIYGKFVSMRTYSNTRLPGYEPPIDHVPAMGSPQTAMEMTASTPDRSGAMLYAAASPSIAVSVSVVEHAMDNFLIITHSVGWLQYHSSGEIHGWQPRSNRGIGLSRHCLTEPGTHDRCRRIRRPIGLQKTQRMDRGHRSCRDRLCYDICLADFNPLPVFSGACPYF